ncbi:MAG: protoporphyrinogen oxidase [Pseudohongiellaceae bacterium]
MIVGAGMAGMGAAATLVRAGREVVVLERHDEVGGLARSVSFDDHVFDVGPHYFFLDVSEDVNELIKSSMSDEEWRPIDFKIGAKVGRQTLPWPPSAAGALKLPLSGIYSFLKNSIRRTVPKTYVAADYMRGMFGEKMWKIFLGPYLSKKVPVGGGPAKLHRDWWNQTARTVHNVADVKRDKALQLEPQLIERYLDRYPAVRKQMDADAAAAAASGGADGANPTGLNRYIKIFQGLARMAFNKQHKKVLYPPGGVGQICQRVAEDCVKRGVRLELNAANVDLERDGERVSKVTWNGGEVVNPAAVIWTGSVHRLCALTDIDREELPFMTILLALMKIKKPLKDGDDLYTYIAEDDMAFNRVYYPNRSVAGLCPEGKDSLCVEVTRGAFTDDADRDALTENIKRGLDRLGVCKPDDIEAIEYMFVPDSYPVYPLDYREKLDRIWSKLDRIDNLRSIGRSGQFWYNNMARSMRVGMETAQDILGTYKP